MVLKMYFQNAEIPRCSEPRIMSGNTAVFLNRYMKHKKKKKTHILVMKITSLDKEETSGPESLVFIMFIYFGFVPQ